MISISSRRFSKVLRVPGGTLLALVFLCGSVSAIAADDGHAATDHPHHLAVVGGYSWTDKGKEAAFAGIEYEYRLSERWGIGGYAETTWGDFDLEAIGLLATLHPAEGWKFMGGVGVERKLGTKKDKWLVRLGVGYDWHVGSLTFGPMAAVDFIEDLSEVYYVGFGAGVGF